MTVFAALVSNCAGSRKLIVNFKEPQVIGAVGADVKNLKGMEGAYLVTPTYIQECELLFLEAIEAIEDSTR